LGFSLVVGAERRLLSHSANQAEPPRFADTLFALLSGTRTVTLLYRVSFRTEIINRYLSYVRLAQEYLTLESCRRVSVAW